MSKGLFEEIIIDEAEQQALIKRWRKGLDRIYGVLEDQVRDILKKERPSNKLSTVIALGIRAIRTAQAIKLITEPRLLEDISALTRILIETVVTACYLQIAPESELKAFRYFFVVSEMKHQARFEEQFGPMAFMTDEIRAAMNSVRDKAIMESNRPAKAASWTDISVSQRAQLIDKHLATTLFCDTVTTAYLKGHAFIHPTQESIEHLLAAFSGKPETAEITSEIAIMLHSCLMALFSYSFFLQNEFSLPHHPVLMEVMGLLGTE